MTQTQINGGTQIRSATITDAQISASAAIALTKLSEAVIQADGGQAFTGNQSMGGFEVTSAADGTADTSLATVGQARQFAQSKDRKDAVDVATTANVSLATGLENGDTIDGQTLVTGWRVLVKNQTTGSENGIYVVPASGAASRSADADTSAEVTSGMSTWVRLGTTNANQEWTLSTADPITLGTTSLTFVQTGASGSGTVTSVSVNSANGFAGSVTNATTTPAITISTSITGVIKGNGTAISAATAGSDYMAPSNFVVRETPSGSVNGSNTAFTLANTPIAGTEEIYLNGLLQEPAGQDYTISGTAITYAVAPVSGDRLRASYQK
jgi:hypothetical protein